MTSFPIAWPTLFTICISWSLSLWSAAEAAENNFQDLLKLAELDPNSWPRWDDAVTLDRAHPELIGQLLFRLQELPPEQLVAWSSTDIAAAAPGMLVELSGTIQEAVQLSVTVERSSGAIFEQLFLCSYETTTGEWSGYVLSPQIPAVWKEQGSPGQPVRFVGLVLKESGRKGTGPQLLTNHLSWYPATGVPPGQLLLSRHGMDISLLEEVRHRQPFVKPSISREGDAFYECISAMAETDRTELASLTLESIRRNKQLWRTKAGELEQKVRELRSRVGGEAEPEAKEGAKAEYDAARQRLAMAAAIQKRGERNLSSVAPLFLQPERETGELVRIEGMARRAVRIAADQAPNGEYFELEVFPSDSQNLPVVCCVSELPEDFPQGDRIRESVRIDGVFFKSWRYRTRKAIEVGAQTTRAQQLYTPIVVGRQPVWLAAYAETSGRWAMWAGIGFLAVVGGIFLAAIRSTRQARARRTSLHPEQLQDFVNLRESSHDQRE